MFRGRTQDHADPRQAAAIAFLGVLPVLLAVWVSFLEAKEGNYAVDFRGELYPEAQHVLHGMNPFPPASAPFPYHSTIWPIPAALAVSPLTALPEGPAGVVFTGLLVLALAAALWTLDVRDWRVYGIVGLWPATIQGIQAGNVTALLAFLLAVSWATRGRRFAPGIAIGLCIALKLFLWPMMIWLLATRRFASSAVAAAVGLATLLSVLPFVGLMGYLKLLRRLADAFGPEGLGPIGLLSQLGVPLRAAGVVGSALALLVLSLAWRRRSFALAVAGSVLLSPIVWLHFYILLVIPLALRSPRLSWLWAIPLAMWACTRATHGSVAWQTALALASSALTVLASELGRQSSRDERVLHESAGSPSTA